ncbi:MAG: AAA family ATPase [Firmicutes bacterium]|nr:AAA family ATPase [Bacillota bacterium]
MANRNENADETILYEFDRLFNRKSASYMMVTVLALLKMYPLDATIESLVQSIREYYLGRSQLAMLVEAEGREFANINKRSDSDVARVLRDMPLRALKDQIQENASTRKWGFVHKARLTESVRKKLRDLAYDHLHDYYKKLGAQQLTARALHGLSRGYAVSATDVAALSGLNQIKGIHPISGKESRAVIILCTLHGESYPNEWLNDDETVLKYYWEGHTDNKTGQKSFNPNLSANRAVMDSRTEQYPLYVFTRERRNTLFHYAGEFLFHQSSQDENGYYFELTRDAAVGEHWSYDGEEPTAMPMAHEEREEYGLRPFDLDEAHARIVRMGYQITKSDLLNVLLSVEIRPFAILSGRSGTGKTTLSRIIAMLFGWAYHVVAVSPAWADPADLMGFTSPLTNQRVAGALDPLLMPSTGDRALLCLDEFNVAKVEHYFSDFISGMDSGNDGDFWGTFPSLKRLSEESQESLALPKGLVVVATMNFDDSVQSITPRVLDRANVIEFDIESSGDLVVSQSLDWQSMGEEPLFQWPWQGRDLDDDPITKELIRGLWDALKGSRGQFGHRVAQEMYRYISLGLPFAHVLERTREEQRDVLLDQQIIQRLLPKLHGTASSRDIAALFRLLERLTDTSSVPEDTAKRAALIQEARNQGRYPRTVQKIDQLFSTYIEDGYASFW